MRGFIVGVALAAIGFVSVAQAADLAVKAPVYKAAPVVDPILNWTGFYVGANVGGVGLSDRQDQYDVGSGCWWNCSNAALHNRMNSAGVLGGGQIGYNWQTGATVFGIEADLDATSAKATFNGFCLNNGYCDLTQRASLDAFGTVRGRLGYTVERALIYVTGGLAFAEVHNHVNDNNDPGLWDQNSWRVGWTIGGGVEYALNTNWSVKFEGLYYKLEDKTLVFTNGGIANYPAKFADDGFLGRIGVNYRFGGPVVAKF